ncbi:DUF4280 domain-containing protein [Bacteroides sp. 224]|uniref:DUF4280 domain-containing protein n=1 Tax=Bacteroides sp. 224 TaxID=2302936 RepID=UPI0013D444EC|nr:DUF4280 domain-containing protein [Bacteroides sp. 224]NDV65234.1 DUF4280 domain-containing protein [Bacteroides sp. 224]
MSEYATKGAILVCTGGAAPSVLQVTSNTLSFIQGNAVATTSDKIPNTNIMPFGTCKLKPFSPPCVPAPIMWTGFVASVEMPGGNPLLNTSKIQCACGGMISFQNSGQMKSNKVVVNPSSPQIDALRKAALEAVPFCEECEKRKREEKPKILKIYWMDEQGEPRTLSELEEGKEVTLCVDVEEGGAGEMIDIVIDAEEGRKFDNGNSQLIFENLLVEDDNTAYIDNFKFKYE